MRVEPATEDVMRDEFNPYTSEKLESKPTLAVGQAEDLKVSGPELRWWLSRCTTEDGETHRVRVERLVRGHWVVSGEFESLEPTS